MEKLNMRTGDIANENFRKLAEMFPEAVTETTDEHGEVVRAIDKDVLMQAISTYVVEGNDERYQFTWPDKRKAIRLSSVPVAATLRPCREESVNFDTTENLYIEGDNLDVLKVLRETYLGKVKMIYIDPPYNTGNDFVYEDDFSRDTGDYIANSGQFDDIGNRLVENKESNGRFHTDWLNMIYPRLKVAKDLLSDDGVIFISIDDHEVANLRKICDEIFGEINFIANLIWQKKYTRANDAKWFSDNHDHILCYGKNKYAAKFNLLSRNKEQLAAYSNPDNHPRGVWKATPLHAKSGNNTSPYTFKNGITWTPPPGTYRRFNDTSMKSMDENNEIWFGSNGKQTPARKSFLCDVKNGITPVTIWLYDEVGHNHEANNELKNLELNGLFDNPKPIRLIKRMLNLTTNTEDIVLDFFSGSATTAHAVMQLNAEDGVNRKFIMVQLPEICDEKSEAAKAGYRNICEIGKERIRRAGRKIQEELAEKADDQLAGTEPAPSLDTGFRVLKLDSTNMKEVYYNPATTLQEDLLGRVDNIKEDRTPEDLLFQVMLELGILPSSKIEQSTIAGKQVFNVADNFLLACFEGDVTDEVVTAIAKRKPVYAVLRDRSFASDSVVANFEQIFAAYSPDTVRRVL